MLATCKGGMVDVCCIVGNAALGEMLANIECLATDGYHVLLAVSIYYCVDRLGQGLGWGWISRWKCFLMCARRDTGPFCLDINRPVNKI